MKVTITFEEDDNDSGELETLKGKSVTMEAIESLHIEAAIDITDNGTGGKVPMGTGSLKFSSHGNRAIWKEGNDLWSSELARLSTASTDGPRSR